MKKLQILVSSKAFWSVAGIFIYQGLQGILPELGQGHFGQIVQSILAIIAIYQHPKEIVGAVETGKFGSVTI